MNAKRKYIREHRPSPDLHIKPGIVTFTDYDDACRALAKANTELALIETDTRASEMEASTAKQWRKTQKAATRFVHAKCQPKLI